MKKLYFISFSFFLLLIGFSYGVVSYNKGLFPIKLLTHIYKSYYWGEAYTDNSFVDDKYQIRENLTKIDEVINKEILGQKHLNLINFITKKGTYKLEDIKIEPTSDYKIPIPYDKKKSNSISFYLHKNLIGKSLIAIIEPKINKQKLLIYQEGHFGPHIESIGGVRYISKNIKDDCYSLKSDQAGCLHNNISEVINRFLSEGYTFAILWLPWHGPNTINKKVTSRFGTFLPIGYEWFRLAMDDDVGYLQSMVFPIIGVINKIKYENISLTGLSYGANIVPLAAAIDKRIKKSYSIDGGPPLFVKHIYPRLRGNLEDVPGLRDYVNSLELFLIAGKGSGRKFVKMQNRLVIGSALELYRKELENLAREVNSCFRGIFDENKNHEVGTKIIDYILRDNEC